MVNYKEQMERLGLKNISIMEFQETVDCAIYYLQAKKLGKLANFASGEAKEEALNSAIQEISTSDYKSIEEKAVDYCMHIEGLIDIWQEELHCLEKAEDQRVMVRGFTHA